MEMATYTHAYIYLIREREFLLRNEPVFKIGRGAQNADRVIKRLATGYKKGSEIWLAIRCPMTDYKDVEDALKSMFRERFTKHGDGSEYFSGDPTEMTKLITEVVNNSWADANKSKEDQLACTVEEDMDPLDRQLHQTIVSLEKRIVDEQADLLQMLQKMQADKISDLLQMKRLLSQRTQKRGSHSAIEAAEAD